MGDGRESREMGDGRWEGMRERDEKGGGENGWKGKGDVIRWG